MGVTSYHIYNQFRGQLIIWWGVNSSYWFVLFLFVYLSFFLSFLSLFLSFFLSYLNNEYTHAFMFCTHTLTHTHIPALFLSLPYCFSLSLSLSLCQTHFRASSCCVFWSSEGSLCPQTLSSALHIALFLYSGSLSASSVCVCVWPRGTFSREIVLRARRCIVGPQILYRHSFGSCSPLESHESHTHSLTFNPQESYTHLTHESHTQINI